MLDLDVTFIDSTAATTTLTYAGYAGDTSVFEDPTGPDSVTITTPASRGKVVARADGKISFNLNDDLDTTPVTFSYQRTKSAVTTTVNATIVLADPPVLEGWQTNGYFLPPVDPTTQRAVVWAAPDTRRVHVSATGFTADQIRAREGLSASVVVYTWAKTNTCTVAPYAGEYYGDIPELALEQSVGEQLAIALNDEWVSPHLLYKRGDTFASTSRTITKVGYSKTHPILIGDYGSGALPFFSGDTIRFFKSSYAVFQNIAYSGTLTASNMSFYYIGHIFANGDDALGGNQLLVGGPNSDPYCGRDITVRRFVGLDGRSRVARNGLTWSDSPDRGTSMFGQMCIGLRLEEVWTDMSGWGKGYHPERVYYDPITGLYYVKGPEGYSHGGYFQYNTKRLHVINCMITRPSGSDLQIRGGGLVDGLLASGASLGNTLAQGWWTNDIQGSRRAASWSMTDRYVKTRAGYKNYWTNPFGGDAMGINRSMETVSSWRTAIMNPGDPEYYVTGEELGPRIKSPLRDSTYWALSENRHTESKPQYDKAYPDRPGVTIIGEWAPDRYPNQNHNGLTTEQIQALSIEKFAETILGPGATYDDFCDYLRTVEDPIAIADDALRFMLSPFGVLSATKRTVAQEVTFRPRATGTPGCRFDAAIDYTTDDLPGTVEGDDINLAGHYVTGCLNPKNRLRHFTFGAGGEAHLNGGMIDLSGNLVVDAAGNTFTVTDNAHLHISGKIGGTLNLPVHDGVFVNYGTLDDTDVTVRTGGICLLALPGGSFTLDSGRSLTIYGRSQTGFDGDTSGTATITLSAGSTLAFKASARAKMLTSSIPLGTGANIGSSGSNGKTISHRIMPKDNVTITGSNGGTANCLGHITGNAFWLFLDELDGAAFVSGELLTGDCQHLYSFDAGVQNFATVDGDILVDLPTLAIHDSGMYGYQQGGLATGVVNLNGCDLEIDANWFGDVTDHPLIDVSSVVHNANFGTVTVTGADSKAVTIDVTASQVLLTIADGTPGVTVNYPA